jgi:hypothetical protein
MTHVNYKGAFTFIDDPEGADECQMENPDALIVRLVQTFVSIGSASIRRVLVRKIIVCRSQSKKIRIPCPIAGCTLGCELINAQCRLSMLWTAPPPARECHGCGYR